MKNYPEIRCLLNMYMEMPWPQPNLLGTTQAASAFRLGKSRRPGQIHGYGAEAQPITGRRAGGRVYLWVPLRRTADVRGVLPGYSIIKASPGRRPGDFSAVKTAGCRFLRFPWGKSRGRPCAGTLPAFQPGFLRCGQYRGTGRRIPGRI